MSSTSSFATMFHRGGGGGGALCGGQHTKTHGRGAMGNALWLRSGGRGRRVGNGSGKVTPMMGDGHMGDTAAAAGQGVLVGVCTCVSRGGGWGDDVQCKVEGSVGHMVLVMRMACVCVDVYLCIHVHRQHSAASYSANNIKV